MDNATEKRLWHEAKRIAGSWFRRLPYYVRYRDLVGEALLAGLGALETHKRGGLPLWPWVRHRMRVRLYEYGREQARLRGVRTNSEWGNRDAQGREVSLGTMRELGHDGFPGQVVSRIAIERFLSSLPERDHALMRMRADGYSHREVAQRLGVSESESRQRIYKLRRRAGKVGTPR